MVQLRVDGTRKDPQSAAQLTVIPPPSLVVVGAAGDRLPSFVESHIRRVSSKAFWATTVFVYFVLFVLCIASSWMNADDITPAIWWPYNASAAVLNSTEVILIYSRNSIGQFIAPLLPTPVTSPVPAWSTIILQGNTLLFMIACVCIYESAVCIGRVYTLKHRSSLTRSNQRLTELMFAFVGGINFALAFVMVVGVVLILLMMQADQTTGYTTMQEFMSTVSAEDVKIIEAKYDCVVLAGRNDTFVLTNATATTVDALTENDYLDEMFGFTCSQVLYADVAYVVRLKVLLILITFMITAILSPILARGDHRLALYMRQNPVFKVSSSDGHA